MNVRKNIDYSKLYEALDHLMEQELPQMELYCGIGKAVCRRTEKGAAVMASEYLNKQYPGVKGFSPRNLRRMRNFYRTYENHPALLSCAMQLGWIQNVVIMEAELTMELREWYMKAAKQFGWSKMELVENIKNEVHKEIVLDIGQNICDNVKHNTDSERESSDNKLRSYYGCSVNLGDLYDYKGIRKSVLIPRCRGKPIEKAKRLILLFCKLIFVFWMDIRRFYSRRFSEYYSTLNMFAYI